MLSFLLLLQWLITDQCTDAPFLSLTHTVHTVTFTIQKLFFSHLKVPAVLEIFKQIKSVTNKRAVRCFLRFFVRFPGSSLLSGSKGYPAETEVLCQYVGTQRSSSGE